MQIDEPPATDAETMAEAGAKATPLLWRRAISSFVFCAGMSAFLRMALRGSNRVVGLDWNWIGYGAGWVLGYLIFVLIIVTAVALRKSWRTQRAMAKTILFASWTLFFGTSGIHPSTVRGRKAADEKPALATPTQKFDERAATNDASSIALALSQKLTFRWPDDGSLRVKEKMAKEDMRASFEYTLAWRRTGKDQRFERGDLRLLELNGEPIDTDERRRATTGLLMVQAAVPEFIVDSSGQFRGFLRKDFEETLDRLLRSDSSRTPEERAKVRALLKSADVTTLVRQRAGDVWSSCVGGWADLELPREGTIQTVVTLPLPEGGTLEAPALIVAKPAPDGRVLLLRTTVFEGPEAESWLVDLFTRMGRNVGMSGNAPRKLGREARMTVAVALETDPKTLIPTMASTRTTIQLRLEREPEMFEETHEYAFSPP